MNTAFQVGDKVVMNTKMFKKQKIKDMCLHNGTNPKLIDEILTGKTFEIIQLSSGGMRISPNFDEFQQPWIPMKAMMKANMLEEGEEL